MGIVFTIVLLALVALNVLRSVYFRKLFKTRVASICSIASVLLALIGTLIFKSVAANPNFLKNTLLPNIPFPLPEAVKNLIDTSDVLTQVAVGLPLAILSPIVFVCLAIAFGLIGGIVYTLVTTLIRKPVKSKRGKRKGAKGSKSRKSRKSTVPYATARTIAWSAVAGLLTLIVVLVPVVFYGNFVDDVIDVVVAAGVMNEDQKADFDEISEKYIEPITDSTIVQVFRVFGGDTIVGELTSFELGKEHVYLENEIGAIADLVGNIMPLTAEGAPGSWGEEQAEAMVGVAESLTKSKFLTYVGSEAVYFYTDGLEPKGVGGTDTFDDLLTSMVTILHDDARDDEKFSADIKTVAQMAAELVRGGVFANTNSTQDVMEGLSGSETIKNVIIVLGKNDSMKCLIPEVTNVGIRAIASFIEVNANEEVLYEDLMDTIASDLNSIKEIDEESRVSELSYKLNNAFDDAGIVVDKQILDLYSVAMIHGVLNESGEEEVTSDDVKVFFGSYADTVDLMNQPMPIDDSNEAPANITAAILARMTVRLSAMDVANGDLGEQANAILAEEAEAMLGTTEGVLYNAIVGVQIKKAIKAENITNTAALENKDAFREATLRIFLDELVIDAKAAAELINDDTVENEAEAIGGIFSTAGELMSEMSGEVDLSTMSESVGGILNSLNTSICVGQERTSNLFVAIIQSSTVRKSAKMDIATATELGRRGSNGDNIDYAQTFKTLSNTMNVLAGVSGEGMEKNDLTVVLKNMNPQTAGMVESYITEERLQEDYAMPEKYSGTAAPLISGVFGFMGDPEQTENMTEAEYEQESEALNDVVTLVNSASDKVNSGETSKSLFGGEDSVLEKDATDTVATFMASESIKHSLQENAQEGKLENDPFDLGTMFQGDEETGERAEFAGAMHPLLCLIFMKSLAKEHFWMN